MTLQTEMNAELALTLTSCTEPDNDSPTCRHCSARPEEVEVARRWMTEHPWQVEAARAGRLGEIDGILRDWEVSRVPGPDNAWLIRPLLDTESVLISGLTREQAEAIVKLHNAEVGGALRRLSWYVGSD